MINRDLQFLLEQKFTVFWGLISKNSEISRFMDEFLQNVRKHNDIIKVQFMTQYEVCQPNNKEDVHL